MECRLIAGHGRFFPETHGGSHDRKALAGRLDRCLADS